MSDAVPDMTGPDVGTSAQGAGEGKLPATSTMTKQVPEMTGKPTK